VAAQQVESAAILKEIDAAVKARFDGIQGYTDTEYYAVFRSGDAVHPVAEMTVKTTYNRDTGKSYAIISESGSLLVRNLVLSSVLDNEKHVNDPSVREGTWFTTANYEMTVNPGGTQTMDGRNCVALTIKPRRKEPYLLDGTLWVDAEDGRIVHIEGTASRSSSVFTGPTKMMRQYVDVDGLRRPHTHGPNQTAASSAKPSSPSTTGTIRSNSASAGNGAGRDDRCFSALY